MMLLKNSLVPVPDTPLPTDKVPSNTPNTTQPTGHYLQAAMRPRTRQAYQQDIRHFLTWGGLLPSNPQTVMHYLEAHASTLSARTLSRRLVALKHWHLGQGFSDPTAPLVVRKTLTGIQHVHGKPAKKALAFSLETLTVLVQYLQSADSLRHCRDKALLLLGFFGAFRRSELVAIAFTHLNFVSEGVEILIPRSKTDPTGAGQTVALPVADSLLCPVTALKVWCERAGIADGPVFRRLTKQGRVQAQSISAQQVNQIIKTHTRACGLPNPEHYSSHSLRRGLATVASQQGVPFKAIMRQGRWRHEGTVLGYIDAGRRFQTNAARLILDRLDKANPEG